MAYCTATQARLRMGVDTTTISDADLTSLITEADAEIDLLTGRNFNSANSQTDSLGPFTVDMFGNQRNTITLSKYPVQSITSVKIMNRDGTVNETLDSDDYWSDTTTGNLILKDRTLPTYPQSLQVVYTWGYSSVPTHVRMLSEVLTAMKAWVRILGGDYKSANSYSIPEQSVQMGDIYQRGMNQLSTLKEESERLWGRIGLKSRTQMVIYGWKTPTGETGINNTGAY